MTFHSIGIWCVTKANGLLLLLKLDLLWHVYPRFSLAYCLFRQIAPAAMLDFSTEHLYTTFEAFSDRTVQDLKLTQSKTLMNILEGIFSYKSFDVCDELSRGV